MPGAYIETATILGHHPVGWLALSGFVGWVRWRGQETMRFLPWLLTSLSVVVLLYGLAYCAAYLMYPSFTDDVEATIASNSAYLMQGRPLYHLPASEEWYSIIYGPWLFLAVEGAYRAFGPTILSSKIPGICCLVLTLISFGLVVYRRWGWKQASLACGLLSAGFVLYGPLAISNRGDAFLILTSVMGLGFLRSQQRHLALMVMGALAGVAAGVKIHAFAYLLPTVVVIAASLERNWWHGLFTFFAVAALVFWLPFTIPAISWNHLAEHIYLTAHHELDRSLLRPGLELIGLFVVAAIVAMTLCKRSVYRAHPVPFPSEIVWLLAINAFVAVLVLYPASKEGGGMHHIVPLLPYVIFGILEMGRYLSTYNPLSKAHGRLLMTASSCFGVIYLTLAAVSWHGRLQVLWHFWPVAAEARDEVAQLAQKLPPGSKLVMAFGGADTYWLTLYRPMLVLQGNPIGLDPVAAMDLRKAGYNFPLTYFQCEGETDVTGWIFPMKGIPLSKRNFYPPHDRLADPVILIELAKVAKPTIKMKHFALWQCLSPQRNVLH
jgi:hypothetical protein